MAQNKPQGEPEGLEYIGGKMSIQQDGMGYFNGLKTITGRVADNLSSSLIDTIWKTIQSIPEEKRTNVQVFEFRKNKQNDKTILEIKHSQEGSDYKAPSIIIKEKPFWTGTVYVIDNGVRSTMCLKPERHSVERIKYFVDHLGKQYSSNREMCEHWGIAYETYLNRMKNGWSLEEALTVPSRNKKAKDFQGNDFSSFTMMCKHYNISKDTVKYRLEHGWSLYQALTTRAPDKKVKDHLGKEYETFNEMCRCYNLPSGAVRHRIKNGWDLEKALTTMTCRQINNRRASEFMSKA